MEPNNTNDQVASQVMVKQKTSAKDFFLNLGAIVALYTVIFNLINLLFTVINKAFPQIVNGYVYSTSSSISFPVATLIIFFPIFILLMWILEKGYGKEPEKKHLNVRKWLTYITLFIAGLALAGDLVTVLYYFIDGQELTTGFLLKIFVVLVLSGLVFYYYISDIREKLNSKSQKIWAAISAVIILASIIWGFSVLGSPRTQQLLKYDEQKVSDLQSINQMVISFYQVKGYIPSALSELSSVNTYSIIPVDQQTGAQYEYKLIGQSAKAYELCATFNKASESPLGAGGYPTVPVGAEGSFWNHSAGRSCFELSIDKSLYQPAKQVPAY